MIKQSHGFAKGSNRSCWELWLPEVHAERVFADVARFMLRAADDARAQLYGGQVLLLYPRHPSSGMQDGAVAEALAHARPWLNDAGVDFAVEEVP